MRIIQHYTSLSEYAYVVANQQSHRMHELSDRSREHTFLASSLASIWYFEFSTNIKNILLSM